MNQEQQKAILTIALLAAFADGVNDEREREQIRRLAESLADETGTPDLLALYQQVLLKRVKLMDAAAVLVDPSYRQLAYEMALGVCAADGRTTEAERQFLASLAHALSLESATIQPVQAEAESMADLRDAAAPASGSSSASAGAAATATAASAGSVVASMPNVSEAELDRSILNYSILNGALELLPQSWASMAIIPLQIKMVYAIGKNHGYELDQGHIRELLATLGVGLTSQYLEQFGRKLLGGLLGKVGGGMGKTVGKAATSMAFSFASTYALGQVAKRYYGGGRQMNTQVLKDTFNNLLGPAKQMQSQYLPEIQQKASNLDMAQVMSMVRGA